MCNRHSFFLYCNALAFFALLCIPVAQWIVRDPASLATYEKFERRKLSSTPSLPETLKELRKFPKVFEGFFNDHFGFRLPLVRLHAELTYALFKDSPRNNIIIGKDGWFFRGRGTQRQQGKGEHSFNYLKDDGSISDKTLNAWKNALEARYDLLHSKGIGYIFLVAPKKALIYPDKLPDRLLRTHSSTRPSTRVEQILAFLKKESRVPIVDLIEHFRSLRKQGFPYPLYLQTDGHWNQIGALEAYRAIAQVVAEHYPEKTITPLSLEDFAIRWKKHWTHEGFTAQFGLEIPEAFPKLLPYDRNPLSTLYQSTPIDLSFAKSSIEKGKGLQAITVHNDDKKPDQYLYAYNPEDAPFRSILLMGDSFLQKFFNFFRPHTTHLLRTRSELEFDSAFLKLNPPILPELVIQEVSQRYIGARPPKALLNNSVLP